MSYQLGDYRDTEIHVHRSAPIGRMHVPTLCIMAHDEIPDAATLEASRARFEEEGERLADALWESLPGGTLDQLLIGLLKRHASLFHVGHCSTPERIAEGGV